MFYFNELGDKPSLMQIGAFPLHDGGNIDIMEEIAGDSSFVTCILQDTNGNTIKGIRNYVRGDVSDEVFNRWLNGKGKRPVTWQTLIDCLEVARLMTLAGYIKGKMEDASSSTYSLIDKIGKVICV